jgi:hypothetical protein
MSSERRKIVRRTVRYPARIDLRDGAGLLSCTLVDASDEGVQVVTIEPVSWPQEVELVLGYGTNGRRRCRVAWRNGRRAGLEFLGKSSPLPLPPRAGPAGPPLEPIGQSLRAAQPTPAQSPPPRTPFDIDTLPPR